MKLISDASSVHMRCLQYLGAQYICKVRNRRQVPTCDGDHFFLTQMREHGQYLFSLWPTIIRATNG